MPESLRDRLHKQIDRQPHFDPQYSHVADLNDALLIIVERLEEQTYEEDQHAWCHERPVLLALVEAVLKREG